MKVSTISVYKSTALFFINSKLDTAESHLRKQTRVQEIIVHTGLWEIRLTVAWCKWTKPTMGDIISWASISELHKKLAKADGL